MAEANRSSVEVTAEPSEVPTLKARAGARRVLQQTRRPVLRDVNFERILLLLRLPLVSLSLVALADEEFGAAVTLVARRQHPQWGAPKVLVWLAKRSTVGGSSAAALS